MLVGDRFERNGKFYEVTKIIDDKDYAFREVPAEIEAEPVFDPVIEKEPEEKPVIRKRAARKKA